MGGGASKQGKGTTGGTLMAGEGAVGGVGGAGGGAGGLDGGEEEGYFDPDELALLDQVAEVIQLVVWDFDLTVLSIHSFGMRIRASDITDGVRPEEVIRGDFTDLPFFRALTAALLERGVKVAIASFGVYATIQAYCDFAFPKDNPFSRENINTPSEVGGKDGCSLPHGKNLQLRMLTQDWAKVPKDRVLFFDDDSNNIEGAKADGYPFSFHAPEGFSQELWAVAAAKACDRLGGAGAADEGDTA